MTRPPRHLHIDRLVLPPGTPRRQMQAAIERELAQLLANEPTGKDTALPALDITLQSGKNADAMARDIARQIYEKLRGM